MAGTMIPLRLALLICCAIASAGSLAQTARPAAVVSIFGLDLPPRIGGAQRGAVTDYEKTDPGLGYSLRYRRPGWTIDVYFYDLKQPAIPDDPLSNVIKNERERARSDVFLMAQRGIYRDVRIRDDYTLADSGGKARFACSALRYFHVAPNVELDSYLCVGGWRGKFVKFRMSTPAAAASADVSRRFIEAWTAVLWPR